MTDPIRKRAEEMARGLDTTVFHGTGSDANFTLAADYIESQLYEVARETEIRVWNEADAIAITTMDEEGDAPEFETEWGRGHRMACTQIQVAIRAEAAALDAKGEQE